MTDITELAQRNELLIANGQQTADLLRHLADNEIDSDYFAVVSECESYGKETDAELSITEFALRAAGYVDALVEALEKAQRANAAQDDHINQQQDRIEQLERGNRYAAKRISSWRRLAKQSIAEQEKCVNELDAVRQRIVELDRKNSELDSLTQCWAVERAENAERIAELESRTVKLPKKNIGWDREEDDCWNNAIDACAEALAAAGIKVEAE
ncbi:Uncharacterised protein [Klebsiella variicola]|uniref:hypothetical protein n=1 Tax=Klebsiella variicola TaxID=244366 RepID=UPI000E2C5997|nr:hypothetical protein [Klebsiella variicola]SXE67867.1 Uncharacterised protein [Klebsiella variicola]